MQYQLFEPEIQLAFLRRELEQLREKIKAIQESVGEKGDPGDDGHTPTTEEITAIIEPLLPSDDRLKAIIEPLIPPPIKGEDAHDPTDEHLVELIKPLIPPPKKGDKGEPGENGKAAIIDEKKILEALIEKIKKEKPIDISNIRNAESFIYGGTKYKIHELMHGAGTSSSSGVTTETPVGLVDGSNTTYTVTAEPQWVVADGITYYAGAGYTYAGLTVTMNIPPSTFIRAIL